LRKSTSSDSWNVPLLGIVVFLAILFFHWRENIQERVILEIKTSVDEMKAREAEPQAEVKPEPPPKPKRVKVKARPKRISQDIAHGEFTKDN
jgi:hypothetical protein